MALSQTRRPRPTRETAHRAQAEGGYSILPEDYVGDEEPNSFAHRMSSELEALVKTQFPRTTNLEYALLKCHLIVVVGDTPVTAVLAGLDVIAQRSGAAMFDRRHDLKLE